MSLYDDVSVIAPVPKPWAHDPPRPDLDGFNAKDRIGYNPNYSEPGDRVGHKGTDIGPNWGLQQVPCLAMIDGFCHKSGWLNAGAGYGVELVDKLPTPTVGIRVMHLKNDGLWPAVGDAVAQGQRIGTIGRTGKNVHWVHTHGEVRDLRDGYDPNRPLVEQGIPLDPMDFIVDVPAPPSLVVVNGIMVPVLVEQSKPYARDFQVVKLQGLLNLGKHISLKPGVNFNPKTMLWDGMNGPSTTAGVRSFQTAFDLLADGEVGSQTWGALFEQGE